MNILNVLTGAVTQGLFWAIMAIGVYITYRVLNLSDLTVEGSFPLGGAIAATLIVNGLDPLAATISAMLVGILAGFITGILHTRLKIPPLLSGILCMTGLYSINLRIMGKANIPLLKQTTIITQVAKFGIAEKYSVLLLGVLFVLIVIFILWLFFKTEIGFALRATGDNQKMISALGVNTDKMKIMGLMISNALVSLSGAIVCQYEGFADVGKGTGTIVIGLASVIIGEVVFSDSSILFSLISVVLGSIVYRIIIAFVLFLGLNPNDLRLLSSIVLAIALSLPHLRKKINDTIPHIKGE